MNVSVKTESDYSLLKLVGQSRAEEHCPEALSRQAPLGFHSAESSGSDFGV
jgi:hypothetical protein